LRPFLRFFAPSMGTWRRSSVLGFPMPGTCQLSPATGAFRVLSPSSRPSATTSQAFSILAPSMGFCLQRFVRVLSRTPLGSPCPAFPWPLSGSFDPSKRVVFGLVADTLAGTTHLTASRAVAFACFRLPFRRSTALSNRAFTRWDSRIRAQNTRAFPGRFLIACRARTSLGLQLFRG